MDAVELVSQLRRRHETSTQASSATLVATIDAINETLESNSVSRTFVSYLGACMSAMTRVSSSDESVTLTALCALLAAVIPHVPKQYTRSKFNMMVTTLCTAIGLLEEADAGAGVKWAVQALSHVLASPDLEGTWASAKSGFVFLVKMTMDGHPKARRAAQDGLAMVLEAYPGTAAHQPASQEIADIAKAVLAAPKLAAKAASEATKSKREAAEEVIIEAVQDCLHLLGALKLVLPAVAEAATLQVCDAVLAMLTLKQPLLTMHGIECLIRAVQGAYAGRAGLPAPKIQQLLTAVLPEVDARKSADALGSLTRLVEECLRALCRSSAGACAAALPAAVVRLAALLAAESDAVRHAAAGTLCAVFQTCVSEEMAAADAVDEAAAGGRPGGLKRCVATLTGMLGAGYRDAWPGVIRVVGTAFEAFGEAGQHLVEPAVSRLADMCRGSADAEESASLAHAAVGASISSQGPRCVLGVVPIDVTDLAACDTWMIPLLRKHTHSTDMAFWGEYILPRARIVGSLAARARHLGHGSDHLKLAALELQMWNTLASFARWAVDVPAALTAFGETLGAAFQRRPDLQAPICNVLRRISGDTCAALRAFGVEDGAGFGDGAEDGGGGDGASSVFAARMGDAEEVPGAFTEEMALRNRDALRAVAPKWLPELLNRYVKLPAESRGAVGETLVAVAAVAGEAAVGQFFKEALAKVIGGLQAIQGGEEVVLGDPEAEVCTFLEIALMLAPGLRDAAMLPLFKAARLVLALKKPAPQKKAYKALAYLFTQRAVLLEAHAADALAVLLDSAGVDAAAKRHRLRCVLPVILMLTRHEGGAGAAAAGLPLGVEDAPAQAARLVTELVLGIKEVNTKTRVEAYSVLVRTAHALHDAQPPQHTLAEASAALANGGLQRLFSRILAGVASQTPRMVSAAVMAIARLTFEFASELQVIAAELLPPVCTLLQSKAREVVKAALGFLKVVALRVPVDLVTPHLPLIITGVLVWAEDSKNKFKLKVRRLVERLCKRCGYEAVAAAWPESDEKLLAAVRKGMARAARQKNSGGGGGDGASEGGASGVSRARTARASEWGHSRIFSDEDMGAGEDGDARSRAGMSTKSKNRGNASRGAKSDAEGKGGGRGKSRLADGEGNPVDLLDASTARALVRTAACGDAEEEAVEFERNPLGKLVFREEEDDVMASPKRRKRKHGDIGSDDSDFEDMRGIAGLGAAIKATKNAESLKGAAKYANSHKSGISHKSGLSRKSRGSGAPRGGQQQHSGAKYRSKKAAGDSQHGSKVEPYAYWRLDKNLLNTRKEKSRGAKSNLGSVIKTDAPSKGNKAKKRRQAQ
eukprot:jgi/Ulvmu1/526/UM001_0534.1